MTNADRARALAIQCEQSLRKSDEICGQRPNARQVEERVKIFNRLCRDTIAALDAAREEGWQDGFSDAKKPLEENLADERRKVCAEIEAGIDSLHTMYGQCVVRGDVSAIVRKVAGGGDE